MICTNCSRRIFVVRWSAAADITTAGRHDDEQPSLAHACMLASRLLRLSSCLGEGKEKGADDHMDAIPLFLMVLVELSH